MQGLRSRRIDERLRAKYQPMKNDKLLFNLDLASISVSISKETIRNLDQGSNGLQTETN